jgi:hypothetical protein
MAFSLLANSNSKFDKNQISFGTVDFQLHPPTLTLVFASLDHEMDLAIGSLNFRVGSLGSTRLLDSMKLDPSAGKTTTIAMSEKIKELDELMGNLDMGEAMGHLDLDQKDFTTRTDGGSGNVHQVCVIITKAAEENSDASNLVVNTQGNNPRSNSGNKKEKIYVSAGEWRIIMSVINHGIDVPANLRREVLMGYQYALHQRKKKL